ncbi:hypothetical protein [Actinopolyspora lacussalsi]
MLQRSAGATQSQLSSATDILQGRVSEIVNGSRRITAFDVYERIADGLNMPDEVRVLFGLAPVRPLGVDHLGTAGDVSITVQRRLGYSAGSCHREHDRDRGGARAGHCRDE